MHKIRVTCFTKKSNHWCRLWHYYTIRKNGLVSNTLSSWQPDSDWHQRAWQAKVKSTSLQNWHTHTHTLFASWTGNISSQSQWKLTAHFHPSTIPQLCTHSLSSNNHPSIHPSIRPSLTHQTGLVCTVMGGGCKAQSPQACKSPQQPIWSLHWRIT